MSTLPVLKQMSVLFLMMLTGYVTNRFGILGKDAQKWLSKLLINITCPALILSSVTTSERLSSNQMLLLIFAAAAVYYLVLPLIARVFSLGVAPDRRSEYQSMLIYSNHNPCPRIDFIVFLKQGAPSPLIQKVPSGSMKHRQDFAG